ncbi:MAG: hypothetical protein ABL996_19805 [Micropepsaceae bacterium]
MFLSLILAAAVGGSVASANPCDAATSAEVESVLGGAIVPVPASEMGEETAPGCLWATEGRTMEIKLTIWSPEELPVLDMPDAAAYFAKLHAEAVSGGRVTPLGGVGERAFANDLYPKKSGRADGSVVVLSRGRVIVFDFTDVISRDAQAFAVRAAGRL